MRLAIKHGTLYVDNLKLCYCGAGNGRSDIPHGDYEVATQFSHAHGKDLPLATGLGWIGASPECDLVLGSVRGRDSVVPSQGLVVRLLALLERAEELGHSFVPLVIEDTQ